jgi:16S rRNA (guanine527-N7)-methyltransferase
MKADIVFKYFPNLSDRQQEQFVAMGMLYKDWNQKINLVSRQDIEELYLRHILHSLGIAKIYPLPAGARVLDVGTGGGFPGIPLAVLFPDTQFTLVDAIGKKIRVVEDVVQGLGLQNVKARQTRVEQMQERFDFIVSRAVAAMPTFLHWTKGRLRPRPQYGKGGIIYLKGGDLSEELATYPQAQVTALSSVFEESFFETKKVVYLPTSR